MPRTLSPDELRQMILDELNAFHDEKGRWSSEKDAVIYSVTQNAEEERGGMEKKRGKYKGGKVTSLYGANTGEPDKQCGKVDFKTGRRKRKTRSCKSYPKRYGQNEDLDPITAIPTSSEEGRKAKTPRRRKDRNFPGYGEMAKLANGLMEVNGEKYVSIRRLRTASRMIHEQNQRCPDYCIDAVLRLVQKVNVAQNPPKAKG